MSEEIRVLQFGENDWQEKYTIPSNIDFHHLMVINNDEKLFYDVIFMDGIPSDDQFNVLSKITKSYTLFVVDDIIMTPKMTEYYHNRMGRRIKRSDIQAFLLGDIINFFPTPYGEKFKFVNMSVSQNFKGKVVWNGNCGVKLEGLFGDDFTQVAFWRNNIPVFESQAIEMWLEYKKDNNIEIALSITQFKTGTVSEVQQTWYFTEKDLQEMILLDNRMKSGPVFVSLLAKGKGKLEIIALHDRYSRRGYGTFIPGGERFVTSNREEIFHYFDPGDRKPPLNVYFSGYKTRQGFEGYNMMKKMGCPFLLIGEPRLEGGAFYMGDEEYENALVNIIGKYAKKLGFSKEQVILSGFSMGTFGALYYACDINPHAVIVGKPLINIGNVAKNERIHRPGGFATSLDVVNFVSGNTTDEDIKFVNDKFWNKFNSTKWGKTKFIMSYMIEDDYDNEAYKMLLSHLQSPDIQVYGKGIHGRHNDATADIAGWFKVQYEKVLFEDFGRGKKK